MKQMWNTWHFRSISKARFPHIFFSATQLTASMPWTLSTTLCALETISIFWTPSAFLGIMCDFQSNYESKLITVSSFASFWQLHCRPWLHSCTNSKQFNENVHKMHGVSWDMSHYLFGSNFASSPVWNEVNHTS